MRLFVFFFLPYGVRMLLGQLGSGEDPGISRSSTQHGQELLRCCGVCTGTCGAVKD